MLRDYSDAMLDKLERQIQDINNSDICFITDALGDLWYGFSSLVGWLEIDDDANNLSAYHKKVLDMHNTSVEKLRKIFFNVRATDTDASDNVLEACHETSALTALITGMREVIDPSAGSFTVEGINAHTDGLVNKLEKTDKEFQKAYVGVQRERDWRQVKKTAKKLVKGVLSFAVNIGKAVVTPGPARFAYGWNAINDFFSVASDISVLGTIAIGAIGGEVFGAKEFRDRMTDEAKEKADVDGLADILAKEDCPALIITALRFTDTAASAVALADTASGIVDNVGEAEKVLGSDIFTNETKMGYSADLVKEWAGFSPTDYSNSTNIGKFKNCLGRLKNIKNIYNTTVGLHDDGVAKTTAGKFSLGSFGKDTYKHFSSVIEDTEEIVNAWAAAPA